MQKNQIGTVTCTNRPDVWKIWSTMAMLCGEKFGCNVTVTSVRYKATGEEVPRRDAMEKDVENETTNVLSSTERES